MLPPFGTKRLMDGGTRKRGNSNLEGQRSRVEAGERKMSSVALVAFFKELLPLLETHIWIDRYTRCILSELWASTWITYFLWPCILTYSIFIINNYRPHNHDIIVCPNLDSWSYSFSLNTQTRPAGVNVHTPVPLCSAGFLVSHCVTMWRQSMSCMHFRLCMCVMLFIWLCCHMCGPNTTQILPPAPHVCGVRLSALWACPAWGAWGLCQGTDGGGWAGGQQGTEAVGTAWTLPILWPRQAKSWCSVFFLN